jgi:hypothetical protein
MQITNFFTAFAMAKRLYKALYLIFPTPDPSCLVPVYLGARTGAVL